APHPRTACRHRQGNRRLRPELRRERARAAGTADARAEPAGERLGRHRGGHGHQRAAAQSQRSGGCDHRVDRRADAVDRRPDALHPGAGFPDRGHHQRLVRELPYQVNKARLIEKIAELVKEKKLEGISELRDESDKDGMRIVIEIRKDAMADVVLNNLFQQTQLQVTFGINMVALLDGQPRLLNLKDILEAFSRHRREVVTRRTIFELRKARARAHNLEGLTVALANIDEMIELIKNSASPAEARERMLARKWQPGMVGALLAAAGAEASRPEDMDPRDGLKPA